MAEDALFTVLCAKVGGRSGYFRFFTSSFLVLFAPTFFMSVSKFESETLDFLCVSISITSSELTLFPPPLILLPGLVSFGSTSFL